MLERDGTGARASFKGPVYVLPQWVVDKYAVVEGDGSVGGSLCGPHRIVNAFTVVCLICFAFLGAKNLRKIMRQRQPLLPTLSNPLHMTTSPCCHSL